MPETIWWTLYAAHFALSLTCVLLVLRRRGEPIAMLAWIFAIITLPFVGPLLYFMLGATRIRRRADRRRRRVIHWIHAIDREAQQRAREDRAEIANRLPEHLAGIEHLVRRLIQVPALTGNEVRVFNDAEATYAALESAIRAARQHVHLQYYIWQPDDTGLHFRDLLLKKAAEGVECRVLLDAVGCWKLRRSFYQPWLDAGVKVGFFLPFLPLRRRRWSLHLRNHRKIAVCDAQTAFLGSQNIGDEYRGRLKRLSPWFDTHMRICGPAALYAQQTFAEDWVFATRELLSGDRYFCPPQRPGSTIVQVIPTGPDQDVSVLNQLAFSAVASAKSSVRIATPYFVPGQALRIALIHAAYRGVRVQLVLPSRSDNALVLLAGRSFYAELLDAGAEIYEFDAGMLHSKIITIDDQWCVLGSANMDVRSFQLNFEISAIVYDQQMAAELARYIEMRCSQSKRVLHEDVWNRGLITELAEGAARLFSPLL